MQPQRQQTPQPPSSATLLRGGVTGTAAGAHPDAPAVRGARVLEHAVGRAVRGHHRHLCSDAKLLQHLQVMQVPAISTFTTTFRADLSCRAWSTPACNCRTPLGHSHAAIVHFCRCKGREVRRHLRSRLHGGQVRIRAHDDAHLCRTCTMPLFAPACSAAGATKTDPHFQQVY